MLGMFLDNSQELSAALQTMLLFLAAVFALSLSMLMMGMGVRRSNLNNASRPKGRIGTGPPRMQG